MQRGTFGKAMRHLVAIGTLVTALAMFACGGDSDTKDVSVTVGLTNSTVVAVQAVPLTIPNGQVFTPAITGTVTLTFNTVNTFTLGGSAGIAATGVVTYTPPACEFDVRVPGSLLSRPVTCTPPYLYAYCSTERTETRYICSAHITQPAIGCWTV